MSHAQRLGALAAGLALLLVQGCTGGEDPPPEPTSSAAPSDPSETTTGPGEETSTAEPATAPANGITLRVRSAQVNAPKGWTAGSSNGQTFRSASGDLALVSIGWLGTQDESLQELARFSERLDFSRGPETGYDLQLDGEPAYHVSGKDQVDFVDYVGALHEGQWVRVEFRVPDVVPVKERREIVESVLASFRWR